MRAIRRRLGLRECCGSCAAFESLESTLIGASAFARLRREVLRSVGFLGCKSTVAAARTLTASIGSAWRFFLRHGRRQTLARETGDPGRMSTAAFISRPRHGPIPDPGIDTFREVAREILQRQRVDALDVFNRGVADHDGLLFHFPAPSLRGARGSARRQGWRPTDSGRSAARWRGCTSERDGSVLARVRDACESAYLAK